MKKGVFLLLLFSVACSENNKPQTQTTRRAIMQTKNI